MKNFSIFKSYLTRLRGLAVLTLMLFVIGIGNAWGTEGDELAVCQGTGSGYGTRRTLTDSHSVGWVLSTGQSGYLGTNSATNHNKVKPTAADLPVVKGVKADATTSTTGYYFYYTSTAISNVGSVVFSYTGNSGNTSATAYILSSSTAASSGSATWSQVSLASGSGLSAQGASLGSSGTFTFKLSTTETGAKYYGIVIVTTSTKRMTAGTITIKEGATGGTSYTVSYNSNGGSGSMSDGTGSSVTIAGCSFTAPSGKIFDKWNTAANGSGTDYTPGTSVTTDLTLYAQWVNAYTVTYNANGGTSTMTDSNSPYKSGATVTTLSCTFTAPSGKSFSKWNTAANGSGTDYAVGGTFTISANTTLYAQWVDVSYYVLVEEAGDIDEGKYLIVYNNTYALNTHSGNCNANTFATYSDISSYYNSKKIESNATTDALAYTVTETTNGYSIKHTETINSVAADVFLGCNTATNSGLRWDYPFTASTDEWTLGVGAITSVAQTGRGIRWNNTSGSYRFATYTTSSQQAIQLFRKDEGSVTKYTVTYALNGGTGTTPTETKKAASATFTLHNGTTGITAPTGKEFSKWKDQDDNEYSGGATYTMPAKNVTLTAQWTCITPTISSHPSNGSCVQGGSPTALSVTASGETLSYQWKQCATSGGTYVNVTGGSGGTTASYTPPVTSVGTTYYKCEVKNTGSSCNTTVTSNYASFEVYAPIAATITLENYDGDAVTTGYYAGDSYTLPSTNDFVCGTKMFVGWSSATIANSADKPTAATYHEPGASVTLATSNTFYAVYAEDPGEVYELVTSSSATLAAGDEIIIASSGTAGNAKALGQQNSNNRAAVNVSITDDVTIEDPTLANATTNTTDIYPLILEANNGAFSIKENMTGGRYLAATGASSSNYLQTVDETNTTTAKFTISVDAEGVAAIESQQTGTRDDLRYNSSNTIFSCYNGGQSSVYIFRKSGPKNYTTTCESCNLVELSIGSISNATMVVKNGAKTLTNGNKVATCTSQTISIKVTPDEHYRLKTLTISGVNNIEVSPTTASILPYPHEITFSVTIPKDGEGTLTITPATEATPEVDVTFLANGEEISTETIDEGFQAPLPTAPADNTLACAEEFVGWSESEMTGTGKSQPTDLFAKPSAAPIIIGNKTYHAVFATVDNTTTMIKQDLLNQGLTEASNEYVEVTDLATIGGSRAVYTIYSAGGNSAIQIKSDGNNSGIVSTTSGGKVKKVTVVWDEHTTDGRTIDIYGKTTTYSAASNLFGESAGTNLGSIVKGTSTELEIDGDYTYVGVRSNNGALYLASVSIDWEDDGYKDYMTYCTNTFTAATNSNWGTATNWDMGSVPTFKERAEIQKPVVVNISNAKAKDVVIYNDGGNTYKGQLEIAAGKELVVATTVRKTTDGSTLVATGENDIVISSTPSAGLGALVMGTHDGTNKATVNFATKSSGNTKTEDNASASVAQYVGTPFNDENNILYNWYNSWMYRIKYTSNVIGWERVNENEKMNPFEGYCVFSADAWGNDGGHSYWMQGTLVSSENHTCSSLNWQSGVGTANENNENLLANSWMAPIKIKAFESGDFVKTVAAIYIFNSTSKSAYTSLASNYATFTPGAAEDDDVIPSMQSFSVFTNATGGSSVTLDYKKLVYDPAIAGVTTDPNFAPRRSIRDDKPDKMRLYINSENGYGDMLYLLEREDFAEGFENGWDGPKLFGESVAPQLYAITPDGNMAINCVPDWEGTVVGFRAGTEDNQYTFSFEYEGNQTWYLNDLKAEESTRIMSGNTYAFSTADGDSEARFIISATPIRFVPTAIENGEAETSIVHKLLINDHVYIIRHGRMYDATGVMVK